MHRFFVTGTDTDVGKTLVVAALARALVDSGDVPTVVKLVQTGVEEGVEGDAERAGRLAGCPHVELARFRKPADPWSAALAAGAPIQRARDLCASLDAIAGAVVAEGSGGLAVPLNAYEHFGHVAAAAALPVVIAVGLRLGCMNHALLTLALCEGLRIGVTGVVLVERWGATDVAYREDVVRTLQDKAKILGILPSAADESAAVEAGARLFAPLTC